MNCPLCIDQTLVANHRDGIEIDVCPQCRGIWLDRGELDKLTRPAPTTSGHDTPLTSSAVSHEKSGKKAKKGKKKSSLGDRLGDILEEVLDLA